MQDDKDASEKSAEPIKFTPRILSVEGHHVRHPDHVNALPFIQRRRLTYDQFRAHAAEQGLPVPTVADWAETFLLTDDELRELDVLLELRRQEQGDLTELGRYFVVRHFGNKPRVCWRQADGLLGHMSVAEFANAHLEKVLQVGEDEKGRPRYMPMTKYWLHDERTPRFERVEFRPDAGPGVLPKDVYNLWGGWPEGLPRERDLRVYVLGDEVPDDDKWDGDAEPEECGLVLDHIFYNLCGEREDVYWYLLGWMADALVRPGLSETAVVMTGPSGSGKGTFAELFGSFFGPHYLAVNSQEKLTGKFNRHLMEAQLVFGDEVDFKDNDQASKTLRNLVTEPTIQIEPKGVDSFQAPKWFRFILASNDHHVVNALQDDRRFLVLRADASEHNRDRDYFAAMRREWYERGGRVAMFRWLTGRWWTERLRSGEWHVGQRPETEALRAQKEASLSSEDQFLLGILEAGAIPGARPVNRRAPRCTVSSNSDTVAGGIYQRMREASPELRDWSEQRLSTALRRWGCAPWKSNSERGWTFPELGEMRAGWCRRFGDRDWPDSATTWHEEPEQVEAPF